MGTEWILFSGQNARLSESSEKNSLGDFVEFNEALARRVLDDIATVAPKKSIPLRRNLLNQYA